MKVSESKIKFCSIEKDYVHIDEHLELVDNTDVIFKFECSNKDSCPFANNGCPVYENKNAFVEKILETLQKYQKNELKKD